jgi:Protein of unknown function (DUF1153)
MRRLFKSDRAAAHAAGGEGGLSALPSLTAKPLADGRNRAPLVNNLPSPDTKRWVIGRKAAVLAAVRNGAITIEDACRFYQLSEEELLSWARAFEIHGADGLRATRVQEYRRSGTTRTPLGNRRTADQGHPLHAT